MRPEMPWPPPPPSFRTYVSLACSDKDHEMCSLADCECECHPEHPQRIAARAERTRRERGAKGIMLMSMPPSPVRELMRVDTEHAVRDGLFAIGAVVAVLLLAWCALR